MCADSKGRRIETERLSKREGWKGNEKANDIEAQIHI